MRPVPNYIFGQIHLWKTLPWKLFGEVKIWWPIRWPHFRTRLKPVPNYIFGQIHLWKTQICIFAPESTKHGCQVTKQFPTTSLTKFTYENFIAEYFCTNRPKLVKKVCFARKQFPTTSLTKFTYENFITGIFCTNRLKTLEKCVLHENSSQLHLWPNSHMKISILEFFARFDSTWWKVVFCTKTVSNYIFDQIHLWKFCYCSFLHQSTRNGEKVCFARKQFPTTSLVKFTYENFVTEFFSVNRPETIETGVFQKCFSENNFSQNWVGKNVKTVFSQFASTTKTRKTPKTPKLRFRSRKLFPTTSLPKFTYENFITEFFPANRPNAVKKCVLHENCFELHLWPNSPMRISLLNFFARKRKTAIFQKNAFCVFLPKLFPTTSLTKFTYENCMLSQKSSSPIKTRNETPSTPVTSCMVTLQLSPPHTPNQEKYQGSVKISLFVSNYIFDQIHIWKFRNEQLGAPFTNLGKINTPQTKKKSKSHKSHKIIILGGFLLGKRACFRGVILGGFLNPKKHTGAF